MEHFDWIKGFVFPYINFGIFLFLAFKLFKKPLLNMMSNQRDEYLRLVKETSKVKEEAEAKAKELHERLSCLEKELHEIRTGAATEAQLRTNQLIEKSETLANHIREEAKRMAQAELARAKENLRVEIIAEAKNQVIKKIEKELDESAQKSLNQQKIAQLQNYAQVRN